MIDLTINSYNVKYVNELLFKYIVRDLYNVHMYSLRVST